MATIPRDVDTGRRNVDLVDQGSGNVAANAFRSFLAVAASGPTRPVAVGFLVALIVGSVNTRAQAQSQVKKIYDEPILVYGYKDHTAPVRALLFSPDGSQMLSGGQDKVINVWNVKGSRGEWGQSIRPPIWRSSNGQIYCMALSPQRAADPEVQGLLAIAGWGVSGHRGDILVYRFPGRDGLGTGQIVARLPSGELEAVDTDGHSKPVNALAFSRDGRYLASGSTDQTVKIWDTKTAINPQGARTALLKTLPQGGPVTSLGFLPDYRLVTGGEERKLRLWDLRDLRRPTSSEKDLVWGPLRDTPRLAYINCLAVSPDGRWVVIGQECGWITRLDANLANPRAVAQRDDRGPVLSLAISPDGTLIAGGTVHTKIEPGKLPALESDVELWNIEDCTLRYGPYQTKGLVQAMAFGPDPKSSLLAFAGGERNELHLWDLRASSRPELVTQSGGKTIWDLGWTKDSASIGFSWQRPDRPGAAVPYEWFDLKTHQFKGTVDPSALFRAIPQVNPWFIETTADPRLLKVHVGDREHPLNLLSLDPKTGLTRYNDGRWWSYSFLPPSKYAGHTRWMVAVGCEYGVVLYRIDPEGLTRVRFFASHNGPVSALAPSPDGRWLATASLDQTIRLCPIAGCDQPVQIGAEFRQDRDRLVVTKVVLRSFADDIGLEVGDSIDEVLLWWRSRLQDISRRQKRL